jgi:hypothetical protein
MCPPTEPVAIQQAKDILKRFQVVRETIQDEIINQLSRHSESAIRDAREAA